MIKKLPMFRKIKNRRAQGMAEFALVLPILLFVIFAVIAFGHLFFSYTLVVAAAREAARFGIATGLSDRNIPRFRDCDAIRDAAVRVGSFAGVDYDAVAITFDKGPADPPEYVMDGLVPADCPIGGIGPGNIESGDRIVITVSVNYEPIVPIGFIPKIPLTAIMQRTLIRSMPIDEQAVAVGIPCPAGGTMIGTVTQVFPKGLGDIPPTQSTFGVPVVFEVNVIDDQPSSLPNPEGEIAVFIDDDTYVKHNAFCTGTLDGSTAIFDCPEKTDIPAGAHLIRAMYTPAAGSCNQESRATPWEHTVNP